MGVVRWPIVVGIVALGGGIVWLVARDGEAPSPRHATAPVDPQEAGAAGTARAAISAPSGPSLGSGAVPPGAHPFGGEPVPALPAPPDGVPAIEPGPSSQQVAFTAQARDPGWAGMTETEIKRRFGRPDGARLEAAECRQDQCELTIGGTSDGVASALARLETARGLRGFASSVILTAPEERDGQLVIRAYAQFERSGEDGR